jgi:hypothetical protein
MRISLNDSGHLPGPYERFQQIVIALGVGGYGRIVSVELFLSVRQCLADTAVLDTSHACLQRYRFMTVASFARAVNLHRNASNSRWRDDEGERARRTTCLAVQRAASPEKRRNWSSVRSNRMRSTA